MTHWVQHLLVKNHFSLRYFSQTAMNLTLGQQWPVLEVYFNAVQKKVVSAKCLSAERCGTNGMMFSNTS